MLLSVVVRTTGGFGISPSVPPMGGCKMAHGKSAAPSRLGRFLALAGDSAVGRDRIQPAPNL